MSLSILLISLTFVSSLFGYLLIVVLASHHILYNKKSKRSPFYDMNLVTETLNLAEVTCVNAQGHQLYAWYRANSDSPLGDYILLLQHGYKCNRSEMLRQAEMFYKAGFSILLTTIRAHDRSDGEMIRFALSEAEDIQLWHTYAVETKGFDPQKVGLVGNSMGGASMIHAHALYGIGAVMIIQSVFAEMTPTIELGVRYFTGLPGKLFGASIAKFIEYKAGLKTHTIQPYKWAENIAIPIFIMQGGADKAVPTDSGLRLFNAVKTPAEKKEYWFEPNQGHVEFEINHPELFQSRTISFLKQFLVQGPEHPPEHSPSKENLTTS